MKVYKAPFIGRGITLLTPSSLPASVQVPTWNTNGTFAGWATATVPDGVGSEIQIRSSSTAFGAVTGSSWATGVLTVPTLAVTDLTATRIPYVGTSGRLVDSGTYWDNSTSRFGVGTASPLGAIDIYTGTVDAVALSISRVSSNAVKACWLSVDTSENVNCTTTNCAFNFKTNWNSGFPLSSVHIGPQGLVTIGGETNVSTSLLIIPRSPTYVPLAINLAALQTADAIQVTSSGGTAGDKFRIDSAGKGWFGGDAIESYGGYWELNNSKMIVHGTMQYVWCTPSYNTQSASYSLGLEQVSSGVLGVNTGTAGVFGSTVAKVYTAKSGTSANYDGRFEIATTGVAAAAGALCGVAGSGSYISFISNGYLHATSSALVQNDAAYPSWVWSMDGRSLYEGVKLTRYAAGAGSSTIPLSIASTGATTITATSGTTLTIAGPSTGNVLLGALAADTTYGAISLNGTFSDFNFASSPTDKTLFIQRPAGNIVRIREDGTTQWTIASGGATTINAASGSPLTVQANGTTVLEVTTTAVNANVASHASLSINAVSNPGIKIFENGTTSLEMRMGGGVGSIYYNATRSMVIGGSAIPGFEQGISVGTYVQTASAAIHAIKTTEQLRLGYDASNYESTTVASNGTTTRAITGVGNTGFTFSNPISCPGAGGLTGERFGYNATAGYQSTAVGFSANSSVDGGTTVGYATSAAYLATAVGWQANANGGAYSIALGAGATVTAANQLLIGSLNYPINAMKLITDGVGGSLNFGVTSGNLTITPSGGTTTFAGAVGTKILSLVSTATNDDPQLDIYQNRVATTDATVTTLHTIAISDNTAYALTATVLAHRIGGVSGTAGDSAMYTFSACVMRTGAGIATMVGASTPIVTLESQAAWDCVFDVDGGNNARVRVTGASANDVVWHLVKLEVSPLST